MSSKPIIPPGTQTSPSRDVSELLESQGQATPKKTKVDAFEASGPSGQVQVPSNQPLEGAFTTDKHPAVQSHQNTPWAGPIVGAGELDEKHEKKILAAHDGKATIMAYGEFAAHKEPVLLIHGMGGANEALEGLAAKLSAEGKQVLLVAYSDLGNTTTESGLEVANALSALRANHYPKGRPLKIVAHSMGGIVSRIALNHLQENSDTPRADFGPIDLKCVDTSWDGFNHEPDWLPGFLKPVIKFFMGLFGWLGAFEMRANSDMFANLFNTKLDGVKIESTDAIQNKDPDSIRTPDNLEAKELRALIDYVLNEELPSNHRTRNMAMGLRQDWRYEKLQTIIRAEEKQGRLKSDAPESHAFFLQSWKEVMQPIEGSHVSVLNAPTLLH